MALDKMDKGIKCEVCHKNEAYLSWFYICHYCLGNFCAEDFPRKQHDCKGEYNIIKEEIDWV